MENLRSGLSALCALAALTVAAPAARAEAWTASFNGIAYGYDNHGPYAPQNTGFITDATGTLTFDPSQIAFNGFFHSGPGVELHFKVWNHAFAYGGIGEDPVTKPEGAFAAESTASRQHVTFIGGNGGCGSLRSASLTLSGPLGAYGPDDLTPGTFHPGKTLFDGSSYAFFGTRDFGAKIYLTSIRFSPGISAVPEPGTYMTMFSGLVMLATMIGWYGVRRPS